MSTLPTSNLLQGQGILYVRSEYYRAKALSVVLHGGEFRPLTTVYEWWLDSSNPWRFRRMTSELLEGAPQVVGADGSDGTTGWWLIDRARGMTSPERHEGRFPLTETGKEFTFDDWLKIFQGTELDRSLAKWGSPGSISIQPIPLGESCNAS